MKTIESFLGLALVQQKWTRTYSKVRNERLLREFRQWLTRSLLSGMSISISTVNFVSLTFKLRRSRKMGQIVLERDINFKLIWSSVYSLGACSLNTGVISTASQTQCNSHFVAACQSTIELYWWYQQSRMSSASCSTFLLTSSVFLSTNCVCVFSCLSDTFFAHALFELEFIFILRYTSRVDTWIAQLTFG